MLAISVATITTAFLYLVPDISTSALTVAFGLSFSACYILVRLVLEFLFFREIDRIYSALDRITKRDLSFISENKKSSINALRTVNREIRSYVADKQREIEELKRMELFRREFIADVSHELKTPIFSAQGFVHTLLDGAIEDKKVRKKFLKKAAKSLDGLDILVQDLLTISQMETGDIKMHFENFDLVALLTEVMDQIEGKADKREIELLLDGQYDPIYVYADYQRIYQVFINLIVNGIKYSTPGGHVKISFEIADEDVLVRVADTGLGIPQEDISRIFERFYRVEKSRSKEKGGTGLGLSIVKHIIEGHQSSIHVDSEEGAGSTFSFRLKLGIAPKEILLSEDEDE